jgi:hypothetical protein
MTRLETLHTIMFRSGYYLFRMPLTAAQQLAESYRSQFISENKPKPQAPFLRRIFQERKSRDKEQVGHRSGLKGRSLDLGLGLAWAPSKVPEEALLHPSSRVLNNGRSTNRGAGFSSEHSSGWSGPRRDRIGDEVKGREVSEAIRKALDADGYRLFKHCTLLCFLLALLHK